MGRKEVGNEKTGKQEKEQCLKKKGKKEKRAREDNKTIRLELLEL